MNIFHKFREKLKEHKTNLDKLVDCTDQSSIQEYVAEKEKLNQLLISEELYWKQRAKLFWLKEGDENTRLFHSSATARKKVNKISFLSNDQGDKIKDQEGMCKIVGEFFSKLFTGDDQVVQDPGAGGHRLVLEEQNMYSRRNSLWRSLPWLSSKCTLTKRQGPMGSIQRSFKLSGLVWGLKSLNSARLRYKIIVFRENWIAQM